MTQLCSECGSDPFKSKDWDKVRQEYLEVCDRFKMVLANHGKKDAEWHIKEIKLEQGMKYLQRKVRKQAEVITKLENKLKRLNTQPYAEVPEITGM